MKKLIYKVLALAVVLVFANACTETMVTDEAVDAPELKSAQNGKISYIVVLDDQEINSELSKLKGYEKKQEAMKSVSARILKRAGVVDGEIGHVYGTALQGFSVKIPPGQLKKLQDDPAVKYVEEDQIISLAPPIGINAVSATSTQTVPWGIARVNGAANYTGKHKAWIVDSGIDTDHPDLNVNTALSKSFVLGDNSFEDAHGHGTHVAGTVAAINNDFGVVGVAPNAEVISCRVLGSDGTGSFSWTIAALNYIAGNASAGDVVNMSLGPQSRYTDPTVDAAVVAVAEKGVKIAIAAGNSSDNAIYYSPARVNHNNVYTIAAMAEGDVWASYSNYGSPVDYIEPGSYVTSTYIGGYATMSGTSMASPHMAGILLLGDVDTDGTVSVRKIRTTYTYSIGVVGSGSSNIPPTAGFTFSATDLTVDFTDSSSDTDGSIISWSWNFGDGTGSTNQNPSHTYSVDGTYTVTLTVTDNGGATSSSSQNVTVTAGTTANVPPIADFTFSTSDLTASFTDASKDPDGNVVGWDWDFGDGNSSTDENTSHTYAIGGTYSVTLIVTDDKGETDEVSKYIAVTDPPASNIVLTATLRKERGVRYVDMSWTGATGAVVDVKVNGLVYDTIENNGEATLNMARSSGTFTFQICETDDSSCSNIFTLLL